MFKTYGLQTNPPFKLSVLFGHSEPGFLNTLSNLSTIRQTYNAPATQCTAAGDPIGLLMPAQANESIVNLLLWTDHFDNAAWTKTNVTATADVRGNYQRVPTADLLNATSGGGTCSQSATVTADTATNIAGVDLEAGTATASKVQLVYSGGNTYTASITWSGGVPTVTAADSATSGDVSGTLVATGIYRITVKGANTSRSSVALTIQPGGASTGTVYASRANISIGSVESSYQPNAACLGGSNRRTGGSNLKTWSDRINSTNFTVAGSFVTLTENISMATPITGVTAATLFVLTVGANTGDSSIDGFHFQGVSLVNSTQYTQSIYAKPAGATVLRLRNNASGGTVDFTLTGSGTAPTPAGDITASTISYDSATGFYRCTWTFTSKTSAPGNRMDHFVLKTNVANGTDGLYVIGGMINLGGTADTYSRNMDVVGGLLTSLVPYQSTSGNRGTLARRPRNGIRNLFTTATATFSTRTFTTIATPYTLTAEGAVGETITLTGTSTAGPLTCTGSGNRVSLTFTPTAGTLTLTKSAGSVTNAQIEFGSTATAYQDVVTQYDISESGQPYVYHTVFDGTSDGFDTGVQSVGTCSWFAAAGQAWSLEGDYRTVTTGAVQTICAKAGATAASRTLMVYIDTDNFMKVNCRGTVTSTGVTVTDGVFHVWELVWNGATLTLWLDGVSYSITVGSAVEESQNFTIGYRTSSSTASFFNGHNDVLVSIDRGLSVAERSQSHLTNNTTYRYGLPA